MELLDGFRQKEFPEQIQILQAIEHECQLAAIDDLCDLMARPLCDDSVDFMIKVTLQKLLLDSETKTVQAMRSDSKRLQKLCIQVAGEKNFLSAGPVLMALAEDEHSEELLLDILGALSQLGQPEHLHIFKKFATHQNALIAALAMDMLGECKDPEIFSTLCSLVLASESDEQYDTCSIATYKAITLLGAFDTGEALAFLAARINHRNPTARRVVQEQLIAKGGRALDEITKTFQQPDAGLKIMAAQVLGFLGDPHGADVLVDEIEQSCPEDPKLLYAIYEALGRIPSSRGSACLLGALATENNLLLMSVITALDLQVSPAAVTRLKELLAAKTPQSKRIMETLASARALELFEALYQDPALGDALIECITHLNDSDVIADFYIKLQILDGERAQADADKLEYSIIQDTEKRVLAVDYSSTILQFYRAVAADIGVDIVTVNNARDALEYLQKKSKKYDLIIADMNMPVMDGMEFTRTVREELGLADIPVIIATTEQDAAMVNLLKKAGITDVIPKPCPQDELQKKITALIRQ
ncbi:response regulator [Thermodesulfobacteriota bacterium]